MHNMVFLNLSVGLHLIIQFRTIVYFKSGLSLMESFIRIIRTKKKLSPETFEEQKIAADS